MLLRAGHAPPPFPREDEVFRRHPRPLAHQRGDDAILECLLYFRSLGAEVGLRQGLRAFSAACLLC